MAILDSRRGRFRFGHHGSTALRQLCNRNTRRDISADGLTDGIRQVTDYTPGQSGVSDNSFLGGTTYDVYKNRTVTTSSLVRGFFA